MRLILLISIFTISLNSDGKDKVLGRLYFNSFFGHVHKNPSNDSTSLTIVQCMHSVKVLEKKNVLQGWTYVQVGEDKGYVASKFLSERRPNCMQEKYPHFYKEMNLDISDMYFWGRLNDHYLQGKSRIK